MRDEIQYVVIAIVVTVAVAYAGWRIYRALRHAADPCYGCEGCALKGAKQRPKTKKCPKNLADTNN
ncbi:MAG: FeoB-associated Cys-rich membrane protein [Prevotella sp.]|nr:FeoB-associated Cys-rich membrane protein [Prevotella sp.]